MDEQIKAKLNQLNQTAEQAQPQTNQNTEERIDQLEQAIGILLNGVTDDE